MKTVSHQAWVKGADLTFCDVPLRAVTNDDLELKRAILNPYNIKPTSAGYTNKDIAVREKLIVKLFG